MSAKDVQWMAEAIRLAAKGRYSTHPNPAVGCIIVRENEVIGSGWHEQAGQPHAEINAIKSAPIPEGCDFYVTLEPCSHYGRTGPCVDAVMACHPKRVIIAMQDPNPRVAGESIKKLTDAGVEVVVGVQEKQAQQLNNGFVKRMRCGRPHVSLKLACSLDGKTALANGESQWITGTAARQDVQYQRAKAAAVLSSSATVIRDQAKLNVRLDAAELGQRVPVRQPVRVIIDRHLELTGKEALFGIAGDIWIYTLAADSVKANQLQSKGAELIKLPAEDDQKQLDWLMKDLASREINSVHCECGARLAGSLLDGGLVDQIVIYQAPCLLGDGAQPLVAIKDITQMQNRYDLVLQEVRRFDQDSRMTFTLE